MSFRPARVQPDFSSLLASLAQTKAKKNDEAMFQTIKLLIEWLSQFQDIVNEQLEEDEEAIANLPTSAASLLFPLDISGGDSDGESGVGPPGPKGDAGSAGATGAQGNSGSPGMDGFDAEFNEPYVFPGPTGAAGPTGSAGARGADGPPGLDGYCECEPYIIPGPVGLTGAQGIQGLQGLIGPPGQDAEEPELPLMIPGPQGIQGPAGGGGGGSATTVEVDLGSTPKFRGTFTITDAGIGASSKVLVWQAPGPYTGKGTRADEAEMQPVKVTAALPAAGSALVYWETPPMITRVTNPQYEFIQSSTLNPERPKMPQSIAGGYARRLGMVRGNIKFSYVAFA